MYIEIFFLINNFDEIIGFTRGHQSIFIKLIYDPDCDFVRKLRSKLIHQIDSRPGPYRVHGLRLRAEQEDLELQDVQRHQRRLQPDGRPQLHRRRRQLRVRRRGRDRSNKIFYSYVNLDQDQSNKIFVK
jgi:hypothetical protein